MIRQAAIGRAADVGDDASDFIASLTRWDWDGMAEVAGRRGSTAPDPFVEPTGGRVAGVESGLTGNGVSTNLVDEMQRLARIANYRYVWGSTGPNSYDCSGLVWRAMKNIGMYTGPRFTTSTFRNVFAGRLERHPSPEPGDIVLWPGIHMGVSMGGNTMYAARSSATGIGTQDSRKLKGRTPYYYKVV